MPWVSDPATRGQVDGGRGEGRQLGAVSGEVTEFAMRLRSLRRGYEVYKRSYGGYEEIMKFMKKLSCLRRSYLVYEEIMKFMKRLSSLRRGYEVCEQFMKLQNFTESLRGFYQVYRELMKSLPSLRAVYKELSYSHAIETSWLGYQNPLERKTTLHTSTKTSMKEIQLHSRTIQSWLGYQNPSSYLPLVAESRNFSEVTSVPNYCSYILFLSRV